MVELQLYLSEEVPKSPKLVIIKQCLTILNPEYAVNPTVETPAQETTGGQAGVTVMDFPHLKKQFRV